MCPLFYIVADTVLIGMINWLTVVQEALSWPSALAKEAGYGDAGKGQEGEEDAEALEEGGAYDEP